MLPFFLFPVIFQNAPPSFFAKAKGRKKGTGQNRRRYRKFWYKARFGAFLRPLYTFRNCCLVFRKLRHRKRHRATSSSPILLRKFDLPPGLRSNPQGPVEGPQQNSKRHKIHGHRSTHFVTFLSIFEGCKSRFKGKRPSGITGSRDTPFSLPNDFKRMGEDSSGCCWADGRFGLKEAVRFRAAETRKTSPNHA
jgi:hypothetical protein